MGRRTNLTLLLVSITLCFTGCLYFAYLGLTEEEMGENVASVPWLPVSATNISYYRSSSYTAYEFDISEDDFLKWAQSKDWPVEPVNGREVGVHRHYFGGGRLRYPPDPNGPISREEEKKRFEQQEEIRRKQRHSYSNGFYYDYRRSNGGGFTVGYDRAQGRAYYQSSPR